MAEPSNVVPLFVPWVVTERRSYIIQAANEDQAIETLGKMLEDQPELAESLELSELGEIYDAYPFQAD